MRSGAYVLEGTVTDTAGQAVVLVGEYDVLVRGAGAGQTGWISRRLRGEAGLQGLAHPGPPTTRFAGPVTPFEPDHVVDTAALMTIGVPVDFGPWAVPTPNAEPRYLRFSINHWWEVLGRRLVEIRLMGRRVDSVPIDRLQPGVPGGAYSILVVVTDDAGDVATGSEFWRTQTAPMSALNTERVRCGLQRTIDVAIKTVGELGDPERTTASFQAAIDAALVLCRRRNDR